MAIWYYELQHRLNPFYTGGSVKTLSNGSHVISMCHNSIKLVDLSTLATIQSFDEEEDTPITLAVSPDETTLGVAWRSLLIKQYNLITSTCTRQWKGHLGPVVAMDIDSSSSLLATGSADSTIKVWDMSRQYCTHHFRPGVGVVSIVRFHPSKLLLFSSSIDNNIRLWSLQDSKCIQILSGSHVSPVTTLLFLSKEGGDYFISGGRDQVINYWLLNDEKAELLKVLPVYEAVEGLQLIPEEVSGRGSVTVATAGEKGVLKLWDIENGCCLGSLYSLPESTGHVFSDLLYCHALQSLVAVASDHTLLLYSLKDKSVKYFVGNLDEVLDIKCISGDGYDEVAIATNSENLKVYERGAWSQCQLVRGHADVILCVDVNVTNEMIATGSKDKTVRVWRRNPSSGQYEGVATGRGHTMSVTAIAWAKQDNSFLVSGSLDKTIKLWNVKQLLLSKKTNEGSMSAMFTEAAHNKDINSIDVSPNNKLIVTGSHDKTAKIWSVADGKLMGTLKGHRRGVWSVQFSPVDQCVLTSSSDNTLRLWSVSDFSTLKTFEGHSNSILKAIFINKGQAVASVANDGLLKIWSVKTNECLTTLDAHEDKVWSLATPNDGRSLFTGSSDTTVCEWKDVTNEKRTQEKEKQSDFILKEQQLLNLLQDKDYERAVGVAITLDQPNRVLKALTDILSSSGIHSEPFHATIRSLNEEQLSCLLGYVKKWNTNSKYCRVAQSVLHVLLKIKDPDDLSKISNISETLTGLIPYTERHFDRLSRLQQLSTFIDYTWERMSLSDQNH
uniref:U3 small nucleolar RNA-associated protein 13 C-terminal domain-containing protein n=1 Tax=Amphimedon queenslandica TaxID=400682 RepID=A0A1X7VHF9_AMPQE